MIAFLLMKAAAELTEYLATIHFTNFAAQSTCLSSDQSQHLLLGLLLRVLYILHNLFGMAIEHYFEGKFLCGWHREYLNYFQLPYFDGSTKLLNLDI
jgi:hypothetical protein